MTSIEGKCAIVTGAGTGIGRMTALTLGQHKAKVIVSDINEKEALATVEQILQSGGEAKFIHCDVSKKDQVKELMLNAILAFGPIKLAVNNAGIGGSLTPMHELDFEDWDRMMAVNLSGVFYCMKEEISAMLHHQGGNIVNISSLAGLGGMRGGSSYCAAKHGVIGLTKSAALEYADLGIRVNAVCPGWIKTPILNGLSPEFLENSIKMGVPMKRIGQTEEVAHTILWLLSDQASFVTGETIRIDGGMRA